MLLKRRLVLVLLVLPIGQCHALFFDLCQLGFLAWILNFLTLGALCPNATTAPPPPTTPLPGAPSAPTAPTTPLSPPSLPPSPTGAPTSSPQEALELQDFRGLLNAFSLDEGKINITWDERFLGEEFNGISFDVFVALGDYNYTAELVDAQTTVDELVDVFDSEPTYQHLEVMDTNRFVVTTPYLGQVHTLLVTAHLDGNNSPNTLSRQVVVSSSDPHIRDDVRVVGVFFPTVRLEIQVETVPEGTEHALSFVGPVSIEAQNLEVGDIMTGFTSEFDPFVRRVLEIVENTPDRVVLRVVSAGLEEIFDALDLDGSFIVSRAGPVGGVERRQRRRHHRELFDLGGWFNDNIIEPVKDNIIKPIGDAITGTVELIGDLITTGQFEKVEKFSIVDVDEEWNYKLTAPPQPGDPTVATLSMDGYADVEVSLSAKLRVVVGLPPKVYANLDAKAEYSLGTTLAITAGVQQSYSKDYNIWKGKRYSKIVMVGPVPIELYAQPSLNFNVSATATLSVGMETGFSAKGGASVGVYYDPDSNPSFGEEIVPPFNDFDRTLPTLSGTATFLAGAGITLQIEAGVYFGLVSSTLGLRAGIDLKVAGGVTAVGDQVLPTVNNFDLKIGFNIPLKAKFLYGAFELAPGEPVWEKKWPIIELPSVSLALLDEHRCLIGNGGSTASFSLKADSSYPDDAFIDNPVEGTDWYIFSPDGWSTDETSDAKAKFVRAVVSSSPEPDGTVTIALQPRFPPLLKVVETISLDSLFPADSVECTEPAPCDGEPFFDKLTELLGAEFNSEIFLSQPPDPTAALVPSSVYKFEDFMAALKKLQGAGANFEFWLGDDCSIESQKAAFVNMAAFLGQSMRETIIYDACDENNWDKWRADIFKEPTSPPENLAALYPMSSGCGQLGQKYAEYRCDDECPQDLNLELTATTNAAWIGAPPPLFCGPRSKYDGLGYWNPQQFCRGADGTCVGEPFYYEGQSAGVHIPVSEDDRFPEFFYTNPLPDADGNTPNARSSDAFPATNVEGCCWWGRGVIQTTGRCNFGKLNKQIGAGAGAGANALYPDIDFCRNPQAICTGPADLKWIAGIFFWVTEPQTYDRDGYNFLDGIRDFVARGCAELDTDPERTDCDFVFENASGIVNRGCHDPGDGGCPDCVPGATCDPAHNVPERVAASKQALRALLKYLE